MPHCATPLSFLLFIVLFTSLNIEARESNFFSKVTRNKIKTTNNYVTKSESPELAPAPAPETVAPVNSNGYGLYGHESSEFPPTTTAAAAIAHDENEIQTEETSESYSNGNANNNYNTNGYTSYSYSNNGYTNSYDNNGYESEKQGMSDTRFVENSKYFHGGTGRNGNYYSSNGYESVRGSGNNEGYYGSNRENSNEFDSMEEYERQQGYPEIQGEYVP